MIRHQLDPYFNVCCFNQASYKFVQVSLVGACESEKTGRSQLTLSEFGGFL